MEDTQILDLYWARSEDAITETNRKYAPYCYRVSYNILRSSEDADECVNDTWLRAWNAIPPQRPTRLQAYLARLTRNLSLDRLDHRQAERRGGSAGMLLSELSECIPSPDTVERTLDDREISAAISAWLWKQPERSRVAFVRRYFYAEPLSQVARRVELSEGGLKSLLHRQRVSLRRYLEQEGITI